MASGNGSGFTSSLWASVNAPAPAQELPLHGSSKAKAAVVTSELSDLGLDVETGDGSAPKLSAARALLAAKQATKLAEESSLAQQQAVQAMKNASQAKKPVAVTALSQALGCFDNEVEEAGSFMTRQQRRKGGGSAGGAAFRRSGGKDSSVASSDAPRGRRRAHDVKRSQRQDKYKRVY